ncbi:SDR family NAD(P)-dependent oxidoreductase [Klebsiella aerogenes]|uniref:SDR family NAD(P)-dependent oxidoreductase n=1 Tax=Klebsiella aerogenes TaxID=548 RepID=UPI0038778F20
MSRRAHQPSAGGADPASAADTSDRQWREALDANLNSAFASVRACLPSLIACRGNVLFVASSASRHWRSLVSAAALLPMPPALQMSTSIP